LSAKQNGAPAHTPHLAQDYIASNCSEFIGKYEWLPNGYEWLPDSPDVNHIDYNLWGVML